MNVCAGMHVFSVFYVRELVEVRVPSSIPEVCMVTLRCLDALMHETSVGSLSFFTSAFCVTRAVY